VLEYIYRLDGLMATDFPINKLGGCVTGEVAHEDQSTTRLPLGGVQC
jgi:hypothetical protein